MRQETAMEEEREDDLTITGSRPREEVVSPWRKDEDLNNITVLPPGRGDEIPFVPTYTQVPLFRRDPEEVVVAMPGTLVNKGKESLGAISKKRTVLPGGDTPKSTKEKEKTVLPQLPPKPSPSKAGKATPEEDWPELPGGLQSPSATSNLEGKTLYSKTVKKTQRKSVDKGNSQRSDI